MIAWSNFEQNNSNIKKDFESLCRSLFKAEFCPEMTVLRSNPNHPGIEADPVIIKNGKKASFQAKHFKNNVSYKDIEGSIDKILEWYTSGMDEVYLFCNKNITRNCDSFKRIEAKLSEKNIQVVIVSDEEIIEMVMRHQHIEKAFFGVKSIPFGRFEKSVHASLDDLGIRYNRDFNVLTKSSTELDLFLRNDRAVSYINQKKADILEEIKDHAKRNPMDVDYVEKVYLSIEALDDVTKDTILDATKWYEIVEAIIKEEKGNKENRIENGEISRDSLDEEYWELELTEGLKLGLSDKALLETRFVLLTGDAGVGKSHLFAFESNQRIKEGLTTLFLLGESFATTDSISIQILKKLNLDCSMEEFCSYLERIGEEQGRDIIIFIDAINESAHKDIWKNGLRDFVDLIGDYQNIRVAISYRNGYEKMLLSDGLKKYINDQKIVKIAHNGFTDESVDALKAFFDYYDIPFSPVYVLQERMTNPLFLTIFCKTYKENQRKLSMAKVFHNYVSVTEDELKKKFGIESDSKFLWDLLGEVSAYCIENNTRHIEKEELYKFEYWNTYGISDKQNYVHTIVKGGLLNGFPIDDKEYIGFGYDLLREYLLAEYIVNKYTDISELKQFLIKDILQITDGTIGNYGNEQLLYCVIDIVSSRHRTEINDILELVTDEDDSDRLNDGYIESYSWRNDDNISAQKFTDFINNHSVWSNTVLRTLVENSVRVNSELNAKFLHEKLKAMSMAQRDSRWTIYINELYQSYNRVYQIIELFEHDLCACDIDDDECELFLLLFGWMFTASNRSLRDNASKAMINLLAMHQQKIVWLISRFIDVDDPYVVERVLCNCLGTILSWKTEKNLYGEIAKYIYESIFDKKIVVEDALIREYARLIIESYIKLYTNDIGIDIEKILPPYGSDDIPVMNKQDYRKDDYGSGFNAIVSSMYPNDISEFSGMCGDFGRNIFESDIHGFKDVSVENCYHYAMQYIRDKLGYSDDLFSEYDSHTRKAGYYYARNPVRVERIGEKYQWIALRNVIAKLGDNHRLVEEEYDGTWQLYSIRDFDPTIRDIKQPESGEFPIFEDFTITEDFAQSDDSEVVRKWLAENGKYIESNARSLIVEDKDGVKWVRLSINSEQNKKIFSLRRCFFDTEKGNQHGWFQAEAYFVKNKDKEKLFQLSKEADFWGQWFPRENSSTMVMFGEYPWSPACNELRKYEWQTADATPLVKNSKELSEIEVMNSTIYALWESQYDATNEDFRKQTIPCLQMLKKLKLHEGILNGTFYDESDKLAAFDSKNVGVPEGLMVRFDLLQKYLKENDRGLVWILLSEKRYYCGGRNENQRWSEWSGAALLDGDKVEYSMFCTNLEKMRG